MTTLERVIEQLFLGLGAILMILPLAIVAWIYQKGAKKKRMSKDLKSEDGDGKMK